MKTPAVSVLIPFYNAAKTLGRALTSLARQSFGDFEVVMVDDGSTDGSASLAAAFAREDKRFRLVPSERVGLPAALNLGLGSCRGGYVCRMDADDYSVASRIERQYFFMEAERDLTLAGCLVKPFPKRSVGRGLKRYIQWQNSLVSREEIAREIFVESPFAHPSVMFVKEHVEMVGGYRDLDGPEDYDLWLRLFAAGRSMAKVPEVLLLWREREARLTRTDPRYATSKFWRLKGPFLASHLKAQVLGEREILIWGRRYAGRLAKALIEGGVKISGFITIDPKRVGRTRIGLPVYGPDILRKKNGAFVISAVSTRGARSDIRAMLKDSGFRETTDFLVAG